MGMCLYVKNPMMPQALSDFIINFASCRDLLTHAMGYALTHTEGALMHTKDIFMQYKYSLT